MRKLLSLILVCAMILTAIPFMSSVAEAAPITENLSPTADGYAYSGSPDHVYNDTDGLPVGQDGSYLKSFAHFNVYGLEWTDVISATLHLKYWNGNQKEGGIEIGAFAMMSDWDSDTITWNNMPEFDDMSDSHLWTVGQTWITLDVTSIMRSQANETTYGIGLENVSGGWSAVFWANDADVVADRPYLEIEHTGTIGWGPIFTSTPVTTGAAGVQYSYDADTNCSTSFYLKVAPSFLHINSTSGVVFGIPTAPGSYTVTIRGYATAGLANRTQTFTLIVVEGTSPSVYSSDSGIDGYIIEETDVHVNVPQGIIDRSTGDEHRTYISIDTSGVPDSVDVTSATLHFRLDAGLIAQFYVYSLEYGNSLTAAAWESGSLLGYFVKYHPSWVEIEIPVTMINKTGSTQFEIASVLYDADLIYLSSSEYAPYMTVDYEWGGLEFRYLDNGGSVVWTSTALAERLDYNITFDAYVIDVDTWQDGRLNVTVPSGWSFHSATPYYSASTEEGGFLELNGTLGNHTYRLYFLCPRVMLTTAWFSMFDPAQGTGMPFESFIMKVSPGDTYDENYSQTLSQNFAYLIYDWTYCVAVFDFFGNEIEQQSFSTSSEEVFVSLPVDINSFKIFAQKDDFTKVRVFYANATQPLEYFIAPYESAERFLRDGNYTIGVTFYTNHTAASTEWFNITVTSAEFLMIQGNNISRVISDVAGVSALQQIITTMLTPDVLFIGEDLPMVPNDAFDSGIELVHPWSVVHGWANGTEFTNETLFYYSYYTSRKYYEVTLNLTNGDGVDWTNVTWFIGFPENRTIDYSTVRVYDLNNAAYLTAGLHYDMTLTGIRMKWTTFNDTLSRSLRISMYDANASSGSGLAIATASEYSPSQYDGVSYYQTNARWTNSFSYAYSGQLQVRFTFDGYEDIDASSIIVYDRNTQRVLSDEEFTYGGGQLTIGDVDAEIGEVYSVDIYFLLDVSESSSWSIYTPFLGLPIWAWFFGATVIGILAMVMVDGKRNGRGKKLKLNGTAVAFALVMASILFILWYFNQAGVF